MTCDTNPTDRLLETAHLPLRGNRLAGYSAIVSGAGSAGDLVGVGSAIAILFAAQGASVTLLDCDQARAENTLHGIRAIGGQGLVVKGDVTQAEGCTSAVARACAAFGRVDILINNAAIARLGDIKAISIEDIDATIALNLRAPLLLAKATAAALIQSKGSMINIASVAGFRGCGMPAYAATKAALSGLTRDLAFSLGPGGVRVNCIVPGPIHTPMANTGADARNRRRRLNMLGIEGTAWDIAFAALFLSSREARWITGANLFVDAGYSIAGAPPVHPD
jgi:NAD(P)-dependent dehydrogenase (short-subunit alcohol dehydrogenase family)